MMESLSAETCARHTLSCKDGDISFLHWRSDGPKLHFAHANGFNAETYRPLLQDLSKDFEIFASDFRGHGQTTLSADPHQMTSWLAYRDDMIAVLDATGPAILVGHSMGAATSVLVAALRPDLVDRLVLLDPVTIPPLLGRWWQEKNTAISMFHAERPTNPMSRAALKRRSQWATKGDAYNHFHDRFIFKSWLDDFVSSYVDGGLRGMADGSVHLACAPEWEAASFSTVPIEIWQAARKIECPVTLICGEVRSTCPPPLAQKLSRRLGCVRSIVIKGTSHFLPMERPDIIAHEIKRDERKSS